MLWFYLNSFRVHGIFIKFISLMVVAWYSNLFHYKIWQTKKKAFDINVGWVNFNYIPNEITERFMVDSRVLHALANWHCVLSLHSVSFSFSLWVRCCNFYFKIVFVHVYENLRYEILYLYVVLAFSVLFYDYYYYYFFCIFCLCFGCKFECRILILRRWIKPYTPHLIHIYPTRYIYIPTVSTLPHSLDTAQHSATRSWSTRSLSLCSLASLSPCEYMLQLRTLYTILSSLLFRRRFSFDAWFLWHNRKYEN